MVSNRTGTSRAFAGGKTPSAAKSDTMLTQFPDLQESKAISFNSE
jgi:hypothetical protein